MRKRVWIIGGIGIVLLGGAIYLYTRKSAPAGDTQGDSIPGVAFAGAIGGGTGLPGWLQNLFNKPATETDGTATTDKVQTSFDGKQQPDAKMPSDLYDLLWNSPGSRSPDGDYTRVNDPNETPVVTYGLPSNPNPAMPTDVNASAKSPIFLEGPNQPYPGGYT